MTSPLKLSYYKTILLSMKMAKKDGAVIVAKPIMLLAIIESIVDGSLIGNKITYSTHLAEKYNSFFNVYGCGKVTPAIYPFYYLNSEDFYIIKGDTSRKTPSQKYIRENIDYASLDDDLWELLQDYDAREELKQAIINHYLKK